MCRNNIQWPQKVFVNSSHKKKKCRNDIVLYKKHQSKWHLQPNNAQHSFSHLTYFYYLINNTLKQDLEILLQFKITVSILKDFKTQFIPVMAKLNFKHTLIQFSVSHDHSEIILIC